MIPAFHSGDGGFYMANQFIRKEVSDDDQHECFWRGTGDSRWKEGANGPTILLFGNERIEPDMHGVGSSRCECGRENGGESSAAGCARRSRLSRVSWSEEEKKWNCPWATLQTKTEETKKENPWAKYKKVAAESMEKSESVKPISDKKETNPSNNSERRPWQGRCHDEQD